MYNIICLSNQLWDFPNWTNKKHVMSRLAKLGHTVVFVDPPVNFGIVFLRQLLRGLWSFSRFVTQTYQDNKSGATVFTPLNFMFTHLAILNTLYHLVRINLLTFFTLKPGQKTILWIYHVQILDLAWYLKFLKYDILVYDCVDNYEAVPVKDSIYRTVTLPKETTNQEKMLAAKANVVFATAPGLVDKLKKYAPNVHFMPNVGDYPKFKDAKKFKYDLPEDLKNISHPILAFTGSLDEYKFDFDLMKKLVLNYPDYSFVLIGQRALKDSAFNTRDQQVFNHKNVHFLGQKSYDDMPKYYAGFDAYIIPYVLNDYTVGGCFPVKFHESLAVGLPTVVTDMPAYYPFKDVAYISKSHDDFLKNVKKALEEDSPGKMKDRQDVAKENNWDGKVQKMLGIVGEHKTESNFLVEA